MKSDVATRVEDKLTVDSLYDLIISEFKFRDWKFRKPKDQYPTNLGDTWYEFAKTDKVSVYRFEIVRGETNLRMANRHVASIGFSSTGVYIELEAEHGHFDTIGERIKNTYKVSPDYVFFPKKEK